MSETKFTVADDKKTLFMERIFDAPISKVWDAYSRPDILEQWWGPRGWETIIKHLEFKEGGYWHYGMKCVDKEQKEWYGKTSWGKAVYMKINPQNSFEYTDIFCDENGTPIPNMPSMYIVVTLTEMEGKTRLLTKTEFASPEALSQVLEMGMKEGFTQTLDKLEAALAK